MEKGIVAGIGEVLWDVLPEGKKIGGAPANFAYHMSQFGFESYVVSAVGNDVLGDEILENFAEKNLKGFIAKVNFPTGTVQVGLDADGIPQYDIKENVAWDNIPFTPELEMLAGRTGALCFGSLAQRNSVSRDTVRRFVAAMPKDSYKVFDINLRQNFYSKEVLLESMDICDILKINDEELVTVSGLLGYKDESAGDSFTATFVASVLKGRSVHEAHQLAVEVSAFVCTQNGAMPVLPEKYR